MYEYVKKSEYAPVRKELEEIIKRVQNEMRKTYGLTFQFLFQFSIFFANIRPAAIFPKNIMHLFLYTRIYGTKSMIFRVFSVLFSLICTLYLRFCKFLLSWCYHESISISIVVCLYHFQFSHFRHHRYFGVVLESFWTSGSLTVFNIKSFNSIVIFYSQARKCHLHSCYYSIITLHTLHKNTFNLTKKKA